MVVEEAVRLLEGLVLEEEGEDGLAEQFCAVGVLRDQLDDVFF